MAVFVLATSGWRIYDATVFAGFSVPRYLSIGGWLGGALQWHFAAMWVLFANGAIYIALNLTTGRARRRFYPLHPRAAIQDVYLALTRRLRHDDPTVYNTVQRLAYLAVIGALVLLVVSGMVLWKSVQFPLLRELMSGYEGARWIHFITMGFVVAFVGLHVLMVAIVPRSLLLMTRGR